MNFKEYQEQSSRTANQNEDEEVLNYVLGLCGEAGEVAEIVKKARFHNHPFDTKELKKELGDVLWYLSQLATFCNLTLEEIAQVNIEKLKKRYPEGFSSEDSQSRVDVDTTSEVK